MSVHFTHINIYLLHNELAGAVKTDQRARAFCLPLAQFLACKKHTGMLSQSSRQTDTRESTLQNTYKMYL